MPQSPTTYDELISDEVHGIVSARPHVFVRKGNYILLLVFILVGAASWMIRYPDRIHAPARLRTVHPPGEVKAAASARLLRLFVGNDDTVKKGQVLGYLESTTSYEETVRLETWIAAILPLTDSNRLDELTAHPLPPLTHLGDLQTSFRSFSEQYGETAQLCANGYYPKKFTALQQDLLYLDQQQQNSLHEKELARQDYELQLKEYRSYQSLAVDKVIAPLELNAYKSKLISREQSIRQADAALTGMQSTRLSRQQELLDLQKKASDQRLRLRTTLLDLKSGLDQWKSRYVLTAPLDGRVLFSGNLQEGDLVNTGQHLISVEGEGGGYYAELTVGQKGLGKIEAGQTVLITMDSYPPETYGYLRGRIRHIAALPGSSDSFLVRADLSEGLYTNRHILLLFRNGLTAQAEIITSNPRLISKLLEGMNR